MKTESLLKAMGKAPPRPGFVRHRSAKSIANAFATPTSKKPGAKEFAAAVRADKNFVPSLEQNGWWAFADQNNNVIHLWPGSAAREQLLFVIAHELGHIADAHAKKMRRGHANSELRADLYGWVAEEATRALRKFVACSLPGGVDPDAEVANGRDHRHRLDGPHVQPLVGLHENLARM